MTKQNCWEFKHCGREPGGNMTKELGICPASQEKSVDGINGGMNGGRSCWAVAGTLCGNMVQGTFASKVANCMKCEFYQKVVSEEGEEFVRSREILATLQKGK